MRFMGYPLSYMDRTFIKFLMNGMVPNGHCHQFFAQFPEFALDWRSV